MHVSMSLAISLAKYFAMSLNNILVANEYTKNIPWHGMEYVLRFFRVHSSKLACLCLPVHLLTYKCHWQIDYE